MKTKLPRAGHFRLFQNHARLAIFAAISASALAQNGPTTTPGALEPVQAIRMTAQVTPVPEDIVTLDPFTVNEATDTGYAANETLAGTRLKTNLSDVGAQVTVLTPAFMRDLGVNSFDEALVFTPSVNAVNGDNANDLNGTNLRYGIGQNYSIRGFNTNTGSQSISHDFFTAFDPPDNYNTERTTLALGPNAMLIGVGNPQGTAITTTKRAALDREKTTLQLQTDRWGSQRDSLDYNQPLLADRLALRVNVLNDQHREFRKYEGKNQERVTIGVTARPFPNTTVAINHENYSLGLNVGSLMQGFDAADLRWLAAGKPTVNFVSNSAWTTATHTSFDPTGALAQYTANTPTLIAGLNLPTPMVNERYQGYLQATTFGGTASYSYQNIDPWKLTGVPKDLFENGGTWDNPSQKIHGQWTEAIVEQKITDGLYLELAANAANFHDTLDTDNFTQIYIDPNQYLPNGSPNPGYLKPYLSGSGQLRPTSYDAQDYRVTLSYELNLTKLSRWLGDHNFSALGQYTRNEQEQDITRAYNLATIGLPSTGGWSTNALDSSNVIGSRAYLVNGYVPTLLEQTLIQKNAASIDGSGNMIGATANEAQPVDVGFLGFSNSQKSLSYDSTLSLGWQAKWWDDRLVTVFGYRPDDTKSYGIPSTVRTTVIPGVAGSATTASEQSYNPSALIPYNSQPSVVANGISKTYGAVFHALSWVSLTYNQSSNFLPVANASWVDELGNPAPNSQGNTKDYGVRFYLLNRRVSVSFNKFTTEADNLAQNANGYVSGARNILARLRTDYANDSHFAALPAAGVYPIDTGNVSDTWSYAAKGYEMTAIFNPSQNWRTALTGSINTNVLSNSLPALGKYLQTNQQFQGLGTWTTFANELNKVANGQPSSYFSLDPTSPTARSQAAADSLYISQQVTAQSLAYQDQVALNGVTTSRDGKYAMNAVSTYTFTEGRLKGWSAGANARWRSANTAGYERFPDANGLPNGIVNTSEPIMGNEYWDLGAMFAYQCRLNSKINLRVQLNIQNLPNWQAPRVVKVDSDTNGLYGDKTAYVPVLWELRRPRNFILTTTFDL